MAMAGPAERGRPGGPAHRSERQDRTTCAAAAKVGDKIVSAGDFNGDGFKDVALGDVDARRRQPDPRPGRRGLRGLRQGLAGPTNVDLAALGSNGVRIEGALAGDHLGWSLAPAGDVNGDGKDDLLIGTPWTDPSTR